MNKFKFIQIAAILIPPLFQYPGVAESINSDINNLISLSKVWNILPQGTYMYIYM